MIDKYIYIVIDEYNLITKFRLNGIIDHVLSLSKKVSVNCNMRNQKKGLYIRTYGNSNQLLQGKLKFLQYYIIELNLL